MDADEEVTQQQPGTGAGQNLMETESAEVSGPSATTADTECLSDTKMTATEADASDVIAAFGITPIDDEKRSDRVIVSVKWKKEVFELHLDRSATVEQMKLMLQEYTSVLPQHQKIIGLGKNSSTRTKAADDMCLDDLNLSKNQKLIMIGTPQSVCIYTALLVCDEISRYSMHSDCLIV
jgi:hypothetical protein